jgi:1-acyl-sn-glycerol-3-phosphate acyltransferase
MTIKSKTYDRMIAVTNGVRKYHQHEVVGIENIPAEGPALIVINHSLATYDLFLLLNAIYKSTGRRTICLGDKAIFKIPYVKEVVDHFGVVEGSQKNAKDVLARGDLLCVAPGGMRELLRSSDQRYQVHWQDRLGFAKLAIEMEVPIVLAACPKADDLYHVYSNPMTETLFKKFRMAMPVVRGLGNTLIPQAVKLIHHVGESLPPPAKSEDPAIAQVRLEEYHSRICAKMKVLMEEGVTYTESKPLGGSYNKSKTVG